MSDDIDILNQLDSIDLSTVQTAAPLIAPGAYEFTVAKMEVVPLKAPKTGNLIKIQYSLNNPAMDIDGKPVHPGWPLFDQVSLNQVHNEDGSIKYDPRQSLARIREGILGDKSGNFGAPATWPDQYIGKTVKIQVGYDPDSKGKDGQSYGPKNSVKRYVKPAKTS